MADGGTSAEPPALLVWSLASFHTGLLVSLLVAGLHLAGVAGEVLADAGTWIGVAAYGYLWAVTWWTNRRWLDAVPPLTDSSGARAVVSGALKWGGAAGLLFFAALLVPAAAFFVAGGGLGSIPFVLLLALVGTGLSTVVGAVIGAVFAAIDLLLMRAAGRWLPSGGTTVTTSGP